jgi:hypothetical protein
LSPEVRTCVGKGAGEEEGVADIHWMMMLLAFAKIDGLSSWRDFSAVFTF